MEGQSSHNDPMELMSLNFCGIAVNDASQAPEDDPNQQVIMAAGRSANQTDVLALPWWTQTPKPSVNYVEFLAESSTFLPKPSCEDMLESLHSSFTGIHSVDGVSDFQRDMLYSSLGVENACDRKSTDFPVEMDAWKVTFLRPNEEVVTTQHHIHAKYHTSRTDNSNLDGYDNAAPEILSQPRHSVSKQRAFAIDRDRRMRIAERLDELQELLPHSVEGGKESVVDDAIDHIKSLQLQIKDLCQSRLGTEPITEPIIFREGYGHYFCHQQMLNEPLEEMMGKLLETNPLEENQLLKNKGLFLLPMDYSKELP